MNEKESLTVNSINPNDSIIHLLSLLLLETLLYSTLLLAAPFYWYIICDSAYRAGWYDLIDFRAARGDDGAVVWQIEVTRWSMWLLHIVLQMVVSRRISVLVPIAISKLSRFSEHISSSSFVTLQKTSELLSSCAGHLFNFIGCLSLYAVTRHLFFREEQERTWQYFLERTVLMGAVGMGAILIEKVLLHFLAIEFHRSLYQDRVYKSMYAQWSLSTLRTFLQQAKQHVHWTRKQFPHRTSDDLIAAFLLLENKSMQGRDQLCKDLFKYFDPDNDGLITLNHMEIVFGDDDAKRVMALLSNSSANEKKSEAANTNSNTLIKSIDRDAVKKAIQAIHQDRWDLTRALNTHASIVKKLDRVMIGFIFSVILYFSPIMGYQLDKSNVFNFGVTLAPLIISFTEFFGDSLKRICEAIIYIVTCHPYDVGDRVSIDGVDFFVHKIGLVSTTFKRFDGFMVWIPNYVLAKKALCNIRRTGSQGQRLEVHVDASVPLERVQILSNTIKEFIKNDTKDFEAVIASFFDLQQAQNRLVLVFLLRHRFNFQDGVQRAERQNRFLLFLKEEIAKLGIDYYPPVLRTLLESDEQIKNHLTNIKNNPVPMRPEDPFTSL